MEIDRKNKIIFLELKLSDLNIREVEIPKVSIAIGLKVAPKFKPKWTKYHGELDNLNNQFIIKLKPRGLTAFRVNGKEYMEKITKEFRKELLLYSNKYK